MCQKVEDLLEAGDKWNLSIKFLGMDTVGYLGHQVSIGGLVGEPKRTEISDQSAITRIISIYAVVPSRFIEYYASVLYELREMEAHKAFTTVKVKIATMLLLLGESIQLFLSCETLPDVGCVVMPLGAHQIGLDAVVHQI
ncbi:reverse transcriptase [Phytophthora megakarya]|uniref:Reverse transcriptase n=1 Tax=Phytophthora megakarya TaxID=4795 RepID=A0A225UWR4_9STRA|nr:reverse transcriptase [Phytophthora megakarya]